MTLSPPPAQRPPLLVLCGPTASGKTALALELSGRFAMEVISADSRQVYRRMDIGTAKPTEAERAALPHHLVDVVDPDEPFSVADFEGLGRGAAEGILGRNRLPVAVGGTGLYLRALTQGLVEAPPADPELRSNLLDREEREGEGTLHRLLQEKDPVSALRLFPRDLVRIVRALEVYLLTGQTLSALQQAHAFADRPFSTLKIGLAPNREELYRRIDLRVEAMFAAGLLEETRMLLEAGYSPELKAMGTLGCRESLAHLRGEISLEETVALIQRNTRRYAKRQLTWFRQDPEIIWFESCGDFAKIAGLIAKFHAG